MPGTSPERRRDRIHARRRAELARSQVRLGLQPREGDRAGHRRWRSPDRRRRERRRTSSGPCAAAAAATRSSPPCTSNCCRSPRSTPAALLFPAEIGADGGAPLSRLGGGRARGGAPRSSGSSTRRRSPTSRADARQSRCWRSTARCIGSQEEGEKAIAPLREIGEPIMDTFDQMPGARPHPDRDGSGAAGARPRPPRRLIASCPTRRSTPSSAPPGPSRARRCCSPSSATSAARLAAPAENGGALDKLDGEFVMLGIGMPMDPAMRRADRGPARQALSDAMEPWAADGGYFNFAERPCDVDAILPAETCNRLVAGQAQLGSRRAASCANHSIALATA